MTDVARLGRPKPAAPGCHHCGEPAEHQHQRHATQAEYDAIGEGLRPIDGRATIAVLSCGDHAVLPFCDHTLAPEQPCPTCHAAVGDPCTKGDGGVRPVEHTARSAAKSAMEQCLHVHREGCGGYGACQCAQEDPEPVRTAHIAPIVDRAGQAAQLQNHIDAERAWMEELIRKHGGDRDKANAEAFQMYNDFMADHAAEQVEAERREIPYAGQRQIEGTP